MSTLDDDIAREARLARKGNVTAKGRLFRLLGNDQTKLAAKLAETDDDDDSGKHPDQKNPFKRGSPHFSLTEQGRIFRTDPALAARLAAAAGAKIA
jgi:hypothetical protein